MSFSIILPTLNEKGHILKLIDNISQIFVDEKKNFEVIVVDDSSTDGTQELVETQAKKSPYLRVISRKNLKKNLPDSLNDGIKIARHENIIWLDADFQHPPKYIKNFIETSAKYDAIIYSRFLNESDRYFKNNELEKKINENQSYFFNQLCRTLLFKDITDYTSGFICIKKKIFSNYSLKGYYGDYFVDLIVHLKQNNKKIIEIPFKDAIRASGQSKTMVTINARYLYTCFNYFLALLKSYLKFKFNYKSD